MRPGLNKGTFMIYVLAKTFLVGSQAQVKESVKIQKSPDSASIQILLRMQ
jgi:hypothetical protein